MKHIFAVLVAAALMSGTMALVFAEREPVGTEGPDVRAHSQLVEGTEGPDVCARIEPSIDGPVVR